MLLRRTTITIHAGLAAEVTVDEDGHVGEVLPAGRSYGFAWSEGGTGVQWDREPPYPTLTAAVAEAVSI